MSLDDRLRDIVFNAIDPYYCYDRFIGLRLEDTDEAVAQIKEAFADDYGYVPRLAKERNPNYMTGRKWLEKFEKELDSAHYPFKKGDDLWTLARVIEDVREIAKRTTDTSEPKNDS